MSVGWRPLFCVCLCSMLFFLNACMSLGKRSKRVQLCPDDMVLIDAPAKKKRFCMDRFEFTAGAKDLGYVHPLANQSYYDCKRLCEESNKRLPTHHEWLLACEGTQPESCNKNRHHPIQRKMAEKKHWRYKGLDCRKKHNAWGGCMKDPALNKLDKGLAKNHEFPKCISRFGVRHMVGNLGEWVFDTRKQKGVELGRFNGGLYPQPQSSCQYGTVVHDTSYHDYSIGCRCVKEIGAGDDSWDY